MRGLQSYLYFRQRIFQRIIQKIADNLGDSLFIRDSDDPIFRKLPGHVLVLERHGGLETINGGAYELYNIKRLCFQSEFARLNFLEVQQL